MKIFKRGGLPYKSFVSTLKNIVDMRDFFVFGGLGLSGYGLYQYEPWVSFTVSGAIVMLLGLGWLDRGVK